MDDNEITAIVGWPTKPEMVKYRKVADAAVAAERERWVLHCTTIGDLAAQGGDSVADVVAVLERIRVMAYEGPNV